MKKLIFSLLGAVCVLFVFLALLSAAAFLTKTLDPDYKLVATWGGEGDGPGKFAYPAGLKVYKDEVYVVDVDNHKIQVFDLNGEYQREFGTPGEGAGQFNRPWNIYFYGDELYVAAYENNRIDVFSPAGTYKRTFGRYGTGDGEMEGPTALTIDGNGNIIVADFYNHRVVRHKADGSFISAWGIADDVSAADDRFNYPLDIITGRDGEFVYVLDSGNERIKVYTADGDYVYKWGGPFGRNIFITYFDWFPFEGWFSDPKSLAIDKDGKIYVGDASNKRVQIFNEAGVFITAFGGTGQNEFGTLGGIDIADDGSIFVVNQTTRTVQKWQHMPGSD
jgi:DNA-binding beta-propeller fold protein YncE|tara:strand:+ start:57800 stop:58801 length:1002 start_codon:yes stop_codon:yes gene_type:complete